MIDQRLLLQTVVFALCDAQIVDHFGAALVSCFDRRRQQGADNMD